MCEKWSLASRLTPSQQDCPAQTSSALFTERQTSIAATYREANLAAEPVRAVVGRQVRLARLRDGRAEAGNEYRRLGPSRDGAADLGRLTSSSRSLPRSKSLRTSAGTGRP